MNVVTQELLHGLLKQAADKRHGIEPEDWDGLKVRLLPDPMHVPLTKKLMQTS